MTQDFRFCSHHCSQFKSIVELNLNIFLHNQDKDRVSVVAKSKQEMRSRVVRNQLNREIKIRFTLQEIFPDS